MCEQNCAISRVIKTITSLHVLQQKCTTQFNKYKLITMSEFVMQHANN